MKRSGYEIANKVENKQNGGQGEISVEPSGTLIDLSSFSLPCRCNVVAFYSNKRVL